MSQTAAKQSPKPGTPRLFLVSRRVGAYASFLEWLAERYRLYPYGRASLSQLVRFESERAAFVLTVVFLFDLLAWSLIWNAVFQRGQLVAGWLTWFAVAIGLLFASIVFNFEQGFITSDWTVRGWLARSKLVAAGLLRLVVVGLSAYATAQPLELLVFANDIQDRVHQERVWEEIVAHANEFQRLENELAGEGALKKPLTDLDETKKKLLQAKEEKLVNEQLLSADRDERMAVQSTLPQLRNEVRKREREYSAAQRSANLEGATKAKSEWDRARRGVERAEARLRVISDWIRERENANTRLGAGVTVTTEDLAAQSTDIQKQRADLDTRLKGLQTWLRRLRLSRPDERVIPVPNDLQLFNLLPFVERPYSFAEQRRVLDDLREGRAIQRHNLGSIDKALRDKLQLGNPGEADEATENDRLASATVVNGIYRALFVASLFIPAMGLLSKLIIHTRLAYYYSEEYQAASGHPEALQALQTDDFLKRRRLESMRTEERCRDGHII